MAAGSRHPEGLPEGVVALELDVTDLESSERFVATALDALGGLDILVNNAGLGLGRDPFWESERGGRGGRPRDECPRPASDDTPVPPPYP